MTRDENRKLVEGLRPLLEVAFKAAIESGVEINAHASAECTAWIDIGDYRLLIVGGNMVLRYEPPMGKTEEWEDEWKEDVSALVGQTEKAPSELQLQGDK